jgi:hypothetical protein
MDDEQARVLRLLLLGKVAVLRTASTIGSLLGWTKGSSPQRAPAAAFGRSLAHRGSHHMPERPFRLSAHLTDEARRAGKRLLQFSAIF